MAKNKTIGEPEKIVEKPIRKKRVSKPKTIKIIETNDNDIPQSKFINTEPKKNISYDGLLNNKQFQLKFNTLKAQIELEKSFNVLLDFNNLCSVYKIFYIDDNTDEINILLNELISYFKSRLSRIKLSYTDYTNVNIYFENIKILYDKFKNNEIVNSDIDKLILMDNYIKYLLF